MPFIYLEPIGFIEEELLNKLCSHLESQFGTKCKINPSLGIPKFAYNPSRRQYHSTTVLSLLKKSIPHDAKGVLGIIDQDMYAHDLNFVFGEADLQSKIAVIALARLKQEFYGRDKNEKLFFERVVKEAVHELGHTVSLSHCTDPKCVMFFSNTLADTDRKSMHFCKDCAQKLEETPR